MSSKCFTRFACLTLIALNKLLQKISHSAFQMTKNKVILQKIQYFMCLKLKFHQTKLTKILTVFKLFSKTIRHLSLVSQTDSPAPNSHDWLIQSCSVELVKMLKMQSITTEFLQTKLGCGSIFHKYNTQIYESDYLLNAFWKL